MEQRTIILKMVKRTFYFPLELWNKYKKIIVYLQMEGYLVYSYLPIFVKTFHSQKSIIFKVRRSYLSVYSKLLATCSPSVIQIPATPTIIPNRR